MGSVGLNNFENLISSSLPLSNAGEFAVTGHNGCEAFHHSSNVVFSPSGDTAHLYIIAFTRIVEYDDLIPVDFDTPMVNAIRDQRLERFAALGDVAQQVRDNFSNESWATSIDTALLVSVVGVAYRRKNTARLLRQY